MSQCDEVFHGGHWVHALHNSFTFKMQSISFSNKTYESIAAGLLARLKLVAILGAILIKIADISYIFLYFR